MASCRMLSHLFRTDHIAYSIAPVLNLDEIKLTIKASLTSDIRTVIMLNCGAVLASIDLNIFKFIILYFFNSPL